MTTVATREETWLAKLEIQDLINRYTDGVNRADWQQVRDVYAPDAVWESPLLQLRCESADEFMDMVSADGQELLVQLSVPEQEVVFDAEDGWTIRYRPPNPEKWTGNRVFGERRSVYRCRPLACPENSIVTVRTAAMIWIGPKFGLRL